MFYCKGCADKYEYPESIRKSFGSCEICEKITDCNDVQSRVLPITKPSL